MTGIKFHLNWKHEVDSILKTFSKFFFFTLLGKWYKIEKGFGSGTEDHCSIVDKWKRKRVISSTAGISLTKK